MLNHEALSKRVIGSLIYRQEEKQWEDLIGNLLHKLELSTKDRAEAELAYNALGQSIARKLGIPMHDVDVFPQGSMRTQTTINQRHPTKFDLDIVVKLTGPGYNQMDSETMFNLFGDALKGNESETGTPEPKRRCWRLQYPNKSFYFDVTPAVEGTSYAAGAHLRVRDQKRGWAPTNPKEFADWFCESANLRFIFTRSVQRSVVVADSIQRLPQEPVGLDDILRRTVQLIKLHRDHMYWHADDNRKDAQPISVIIVTLATHAYTDLWQNQKSDFSSPIEVALTLVEAMPNYINKDGTSYSVPNPKLISENFADRWNDDNGVRADEFKKWHAQLEKDLESLLHQGTNAATEASIREVFGTAGVEAWKASQPKSNIFDGLITSSVGHTKSNPNAPIKRGSTDTLG